MSTLPAFKTPLSSSLFIPEGFERLFSPLTFGAKARNTACDALFYDVTSLNGTETTKLISETTREGSILVVHPKGVKDDGIEKFTTYESFRSAPGDLLRRFTIAGVGSSDVGAAAFARTVANKFNEPVGAIVSGYGIADLITEALGGWFVLGGLNRNLLRLQRLAEASDIQSFQALCETLTPTAEVDTASSPSNTQIDVGGDITSILRLLADPERQIISFAGHSKGCLAIAFALELLAFTGTPEEIERAQKMRVTTVGAVVAVPSSFTNVGQYLGSIDWFGGMNSRLGVEHTEVEGAWHHLNTKLGPAFLDFAKVLDSEASHMIAP